MKTYVSLIALILALAPSASSSGATVIVPDGALWKSLNDRNEKLLLIEGYIAGYIAGAHDAKIQAVSGGIKDDGLLQSIGQGRYNPENLTFGQVTDGVDAFYSDYANRQLYINEAVSYVVLTVEGVPHDNLQKWLEATRRQHAFLPHD